MSNLIKNINSSKLNIESIYSKSITGLGDFHFRPLDLYSDMVMIHDWVTQPYAVYWGMQGYSLEQVKAAHEILLNRAGYNIFIGVFNDRPVFMMEQYKTSEDQIGSYYEVKEGDYGMHLLVAPAEKYIPGFTWHIFCSVMEFMFSNTDTDRVVVEPDVRNEKIHVLNKRAGFQYQKIIKLPHKTASLAWCTRAGFQKALYHSTEF